MYLTPDTMIQASEDCGFRTTVIGAVNDFTQSVKEVENWYEKYHKEDGLTSYELGFHAEYTTKREILEGISELSKKYHAPIYTHNSERRLRSGTVRRENRYDTNGIYGTARAV